MIKFQRFNICDLSMEDHFVLLHGVNRQRKMGKGIALDVRNKWPLVYEQYMSLQVVPNLGAIQRVEISSSPIQVVYNCFTQNKYRRHTDPAGMKYADPAAIRTCLISAFGDIATRDVPFNVPIIMPRIGCSLGGLIWSDVQPIVEEAHSLFLSQHTLFIIDK